MAMTITDYIDPDEEFVPRELHPKPIRLDEIDPDNVVVSFDRRSDTLLIHLFGRGRGSVSVPVSNYLYLMVDPDTEETLGIHVEGFLSQAVKASPEAIGLLEYAELRGITPAEVGELHQSIHSATPRSMTYQRATNGKNVPKKRMDAIACFIKAERSKWPIAFAPAV